MAQALTLESLETIYKLIDQKPEPIYWDNNTVRMTRWNNINTDYQYRITQAEVAAGATVPADWVGSKTGMYYEPKFNPERIMIYDGYYDVE